jgi:hypothetical protein
LQYREEEHPREHSREHPIEEKHPREHFSEHSMEEYHTRDRKHPRENPRELLGSTLGRKITLEMILGSTILRGSSL